MRDLFSVIVALSFISLAACGRHLEESSLSVKALTVDEAKADLVHLRNLISENYGPLEYKAAHPDVKLNVDQAFTEADQGITKAKSDLEIYAEFFKLLRKFRDAHIGISFPFNNEHLFRYEIPLFLMPVKDAAGQWVAVVDSVGDDIKDSGVKVGDIVTHVDGVAVFDLLPKIQAYRSRSNDVSDRHSIFQVFRREAYMTDLIPTKTIAQIDYLHAGDQEKHSVSLAWKVSRDEAAGFDFVAPTGTRKLVVDGVADYNEQAGSSLQKYGSLTPFFATKEVEGALEFRRHTPDDSTLKKFGLEKKDAAPIFVATYRFNNKNILLIRQPGYVPPFEGNENDDDGMMAVVKNWIQTYKAVLTEYDFADVLVIDQTHNPGGISTYVTDFFRLLLTKEHPNVVQRNNVDRKWIAGLVEDAKKLDKKGRTTEARRYRAFARVIEGADERGETLAEALAFDYDNMVGPHSDYSGWKKPVLLIADELSASCGDILPMLVKNSGIGKFFGQRTMGAGGSVEEFRLPNSYAMARLTRGLFSPFRADGSYDKEVLVENNGVTPDFLYEHTLDDVRAGYVGYVKAFSQKAVELVK